MMSRKPPFALLLLVLLSFSQSAVAQEGKPFPDWRFGVIEAYEAPEEATKAGAAWTRVRFQWAEAQAAGADSWMPAVEEAQIDAEVAAGREVVGLLIGIPAWARDEDGLPIGLSLPDDDPGNLWAGFVREAVGRYAGRIDHWIIWNEPDIWDSNAPGHTWDGSVEDFAQLQKVAYRVAHATNPDAVVHLGAFTYFWDDNYGREQYFGRLLDVLAADPQAASYGGYFDAATAHLYFNPDLIYKIIQEFVGMMEDHGLRKPLWLVETNAPPSEDPTWKVESVTLKVGLEEQAAFMPQALASALAAGAERVAVYKLQDIETDVEANPEPFGLIRSDGTARPALATYEVALRYLAGADKVTRQRWDEVGQIQLDQGNYTTTLLFSRLPAPQQAWVKAAADTAVLVDMWGEQRTIRASAGFEDASFLVELPPAPCRQSIGDYCMIGGPPYYLIQPKVGMALPATLPAPHFSPTSTPVPTFTPTAEPSPTASASATATPTTFVAARSSATASVMLMPSASPTRDMTATPPPVLSSTDSGGASSPPRSLSYLFIGSALLLGLFLLLYARRQA